MYINVLKYIENQFYEKYNGRLVDSSPFLCILKVI